MAICRFLFVPSTFIFCTYKFATGRFTQSSTRLPPQPAFTSPIAPTPSKIVCPSNHSKSVRISIGSQDVFEEITVDSSTTKPLRPVEILLPLPKAEVHQNLKVSLYCLIFLTTRLIICPIHSSISGQPAKSSPTGAWKYLQLLLVYRILHNRVRLPFPAYLEPVVTGIVIVGVESIGGHIHHHARSGRRIPYADWHGETLRLE